jgi:hypothetical protein
LEIIEKYKYLSLKNGGRKHSRTPEFTRNEQKDVMARDSNTRNSNPETRSSFSVQE